MCTFVMSFDDPLSVTTNSRKTSVEADCNDTSNTQDDCNENKEETLPLDQGSEEKMPVQLFIEDTQSTGEPTTEEQNTHHINANSWCIAVVTIVLCLLFFLYYCF